MSKTEYDTLEELLRHAAPRPVPDPQDIAVAKAAVRSDWIAVTSHRQRWRRVTLFATAATVLVSMFMVMSNLLAPQQEPMQLAAVEKSFGPVYFLGERSELHPTGDLAAVMSGETIVTGSAAGMALAWGSGGSVRIDANSRVRFSIDGVVHLEAGRVYFDSQRGLSASIVGGDAPTFELATEFGTVHHVGTQYMVEVAASGLVVSVREGTVRIDGQVRESTVVAGEQAILAGRQQPSILNISRSGEAWAWIAKTTPAADVDGRSLHEFLQWVSRELGLELRYEGSSESVARIARLRGTIDVEPAEAIRLRLATASLGFRIEEGVIYITD